MNEKDSILGELNIKDSPSSFMDDPDRVAQNKKYTLKLEELNYKFKIWTHPFKLMQIMIIITILTGLAYIFKDCNHIILSIYELLFGVLGYIATFVFSSIFTWFLENYSKIKNSD